MVEKEEKFFFSFTTFPPHFFHFVLSSQREKFLVCLGRPAVDEALLDGDG